MTDERKSKARDTLKPLLVSHAFNSEMNDLIYNEGLFYYPMTADYYDPYSNLPSQQLINRMRNVSVDVDMSNIASHPTARRTSHLASSCNSPIWLDAPVTPLAASPPAPA